MRKQVLHGMRSFTEIDDKIKIHSRYWRHIRIIGITYFGGSYSVEIEVAEPIG
jgi:hypothetical protein